MLIGCSEAAYHELCKMSVYKMHEPQQQKLQQYHYQLAEGILIEEGQTILQNQIFRFKVEYCKDYFSNGDRHAR